MKLVLDWDETITAADTISTLANPACEGPPFAFYTKEYIKDYEEFSREAEPPANKDELYAKLRAVDAVEAPSLDRISNGGLFRGITDDELRQRARRVSFREGWPEAHDWICNAPKLQLWFTCILSVNWSRRFIEHALGQSCIRVISNEIDSQARIVGPDGNTIRTAAHKLAHFDKLGRGDQTVYVGDSMTDIMCLLSADLGILVGSRIEARIRAVGINPVDVHGWLAGQRGDLVVAADWGEILRVLQHLDRDASI